MAIGSPPQAFQIALETLKSAGAKTVLDCPAGQGIFSKMLKEAGFDVTACDIWPEGFKVPDIECEFCDLNDRLNYADGQFDALACLNGLQRVWARGRAVSEMARVVRPGGTLIISFPNNSDIRRRLLFMMTGSVTWNVIGPPEVCDPKAENPASCFRYPMNLANVLSAMESVGMKVESIRATHIPPSAIMLSPLALLPKVFSLVSPPRKKKEYFMGESSTFAGLLGAFLVVTARKSG